MVTYASPNIRELGVLVQAAREDGLFDSDRWWAALDGMALESTFRAQRDLLADRPAADGTTTKGTLKFLAEQGVVQMAVQLLPFVRHLMIQLGDKGPWSSYATDKNLTFFLLGVLVVMQHKEPTSWSKAISNMSLRQIVAHAPNGTSTVVVRHFPAFDLAPEDIASVTGAGDTLVGATLAGLLQKANAFETPDTLEALVMKGQKAAVETLRSVYAVAPSLCSTKR